MEKSFPYRAQSRLDLGLASAPTTAEEDKGLKPLPHDNNAAAATGTYTTGHCSTSTKK